METMVRGSLKPDLEIVCADDAGEAAWETLSTADVRFVGWMNDQLVFDDPADSIEVATDGKSMTAMRAWSAGETSTVGRLWVEVVVDWGSNRDQTFPPDGPLRLDIVPGAAGT